jgi:hypothetical protein
MVNRMMDKKMYSHKKVQVARWRVGRLEGEILGLSFDGVVLWDSIPTRRDELHESPPHDRICVDSHHDVNGRLHNDCSVCSPASKA